MFGGLKIWTIGRRARRGYPYDDEKDVTGSSPESRRVCCTAVAFNFFLIIVLNLYGSFYRNIWQAPVRDVWMPYFAALMVFTCMDNKMITPIIAIRIPVWWMMFQIFWVSLFLSEWIFDTTCLYVNSSQCFQSRGTMLANWAISVCRAHDGAAYWIQGCIHIGICIISLVAFVFLNFGCTHEDGCELHCVRGTDELIKKKDE